MEERAMTEEEFRALKEGTSDYNQGSMNLPKNPGPSALGHTPLIGALRRSQGIPVARERVTEELDQLDGVDIPDRPVFPFLSTQR